VKKKLAVLHTTVVLSFSSVLATPLVGHAETIQDMQTKKSSIQKERENVKQSIQATKEKITAAKGEKEKILEQIKRLYLAIAQNTAKVKETEEQIKDKQTAISNLEAEVADLEEKMENRKGILEERARSFQENGGSLSYLQVLLGASSFSDFIDRADAVNTIAEADEQILKQTKKDQNSLEKKKKTVKKRLDELTDIKAELTEMMSGLTAQKAHQDALMKQANLTEAENNRLKAELQQKDGTLATQETQIQQNIEAEVKRQEEARKEAERKREEARKAAEKAAAEKAAAEKEASAKAKRSQDTTTSQSQDTSTPSNVSLPDDTSTPTGSAADVVTVGNRWIGNSAYVFGGGRNQSDIANGLFDCSSFVHWAYSQVGIKLGPLGWVSTETLKHEGRQVSVSDMKPGDLVFFDTYKKDGHVGIYVGNHKFIGAQSAGVSIADMNSNYWSSHFNGRVVRIIN